MLGILTGFVDQLRLAGVPVSMVEVIDAAAGMEHIDLGSPDSLKALLGATLIKSDRHHATFEETFDAYFSLLGPEEGSAEAAAVRETARSMIAGAGVGSGAGDEFDAGDLMEALLRAFETDDERLIQAVITIAVDRLAGIEPGRPVGGAYYLYRVMRQLDVDRMRSILRAERPDDDAGALDQRLHEESVERRLDRLRDLIRAEIRRRLVADRGPEAVVQTLRRPLLEDVDLSAATRDELVQIERLVHPLGRRLATRLAQRRRSGTRGRLDVRRTMRASLSTGGVPVDPRFRRPRPGKPEIVLLCDVSGSVATFARFTMQLVYAIASQFSRVRTFAFIDGIDEVTAMIGPGSDFGTAMQRISTEAEIVWLDGHSDYGHALGAFEADHLDDAVSSRTTVIVTGDARSNYHDANEAVLGSISRRARSLFWLNPEPSRYWDTGDSVMGLYAPYCDQVVEVRNLRQLEAFVERAALAPRSSRRTAQAGALGSR